MEISGYAQVGAAPERVWTALHDPAVLSACVSGCDSFERIGPREYTAIATVKAGVLRTQLHIDIALTEYDPPRHAIFTMRAKSRLGSAEAIVTLHLEARDGGTSLRYEGQANLGGQLGRIAKHWGRNAIEELVHTFFRRLTAAIPTETFPSSSEPPPARIAAIPAPIVPPIHTKALWIGLGAAAATAVTAAAALVFTRRRSR